MVNQKHFELLKQGVKQWNEWRRQHEEVLPDLSRADLSRVNLFGADLSEANPTSAGQTSAEQISM